MSLLSRGQEKNRFSLFMFVSPRVPEDGCVASAPPPPFEASRFDRAQRWCFFVGGCFLLGRNLAPDRLKRDKPPFAIYVEVCLGSCFERTLASVGAVIFCQVAKMSSLATCSDVMRFWDTGDLAGARAGALLAALRKASVGGRRERGGVADWMAHQLNTGPYPGNHVGERTRGGTCARRFFLW